MTTCAPATSRPGDFRVDIAPTDSRCRTYCATPMFTDFDGVTDTCDQPGVTYDEETETWRCVEHGTDLEDADLRLGKARVAHPIGSSHQNDEAAATTATSR